MPDGLRCDYVRQNVNLPAGVSTEIAVGINFAQNWSGSIKNTGANPVTALSLAPDPLGTQPAAAAVCTEGLPLAAGATYLPISGAGEPILLLRITLLSPAGTTVSLTFAGN